MNSAWGQTMTHLLRQFGYALGAAVAVIVAVLAYEPGEAEETLASEAALPPAVVQAPHSQCGGAVWPYLPPECVVSGDVATPARVIRAATDGPVSERRPMGAPSPLSGF